MCTCIRCAYPDDHGILIISVFYFIYMTKWHNILTSLGLSENEATLYLTSLEHGPTPVQALAKETGLSRVTVYSLIEHLTKRGLMTSVEKGKKTLYAAEPADRLLSFGEQQAQELKSTIREMKSEIHELKLKERGEQPVVKLYEGKESLKALQADVIKTKPKFLYEFEDVEVARTVFQDQDLLLDLYETLVKTKTDRYLLHQMSDKPPIKRSAHEHIFTFQSGKQISGSILTYGDKVALSVYKGKQMLVLIESKELAETLVELFKIAQGNTTRVTEIKK